LIMRKNEPLYPQPKDDPNFKEEVFKRPNDNKIPNLGWKDHDTSSHANGILNKIFNHSNGSNQQTQLSSATNSRSFYNDQSASSALEYHLRETEQLLEISLLKKKLRETERAMEQIIADMGVGNRNNVTNNDSNTATDLTTSQNATNDTKEKSHTGSGKTNGHITNSKSNGYVDDDGETLDAKQFIKIEDTHKSQHGAGNDATMKSSSDSEPEPEPQSIYLEGALPHESQILVADSQTTPESVEPTENADEPAVILSSKMTLSLINLDPTNDTGNASNGTDESDADERIQDLHD